MKHHLCQTKLTLPRGSMTLDVSLNFKQISIVARAMKNKQSGTLIPLIDYRALSTRVCKRNRVTEPWPVKTVIRLALPS